MQSTGVLEGQQVRSVNRRHRDLPPRLRPEGVADHHRHHRGTIWSDCRADDADLAPLLDQAGKPVSFTHWYMDWPHKAELTAHQPSTNA